MLRASKLIREILVADGICQTDPTESWRCLVRKMPDGVGTVDNLVAIIDKEDVQTGRYISDSDYRGNPHIRIVVRGVGNDAVYDKIQDIAFTVDSLVNVPVRLDNTDYIIAETSRTSSIQFNGRDATGRRYVYSIEYDVTIN